MFGFSVGTEYAHGLKHFYDSFEGFETFDEAYNAGVKWLENNETDDNGVAFIQIVNTETDANEYFYNR